MATENRPAFAHSPYQDQNGQVMTYGEAGMSLRQYYAAHAPMVPEWFGIQPPDDDPKPTLPREIPMGDNGQNYIEGKENYEAWLRRQRERRYFAWRWRYADMMLQSEPEIRR